MLIKHVEMFSTVIQLLSVENKLNVFLISLNSSVFALLENFHLLYIIANLNFFY